MEVNCLDSLYFKRYGFYQIGSNYTFAYSKINILIKLFFFFSERHHANGDGKREKERGSRREREQNFHLLVHSPNGCSGQGRVAGIQILGPCSALFQVQQQGSIQNQWSSQDSNHCYNMGSRCHRWQTGLRCHNTTSISLSLNCIFFPNKLSEMPLDDETDQNQ